jgi:hypothetical protein
MASKKVCSGLVFLLSMLSWLQISSAVSAREYKRTCGIVTSTVSSGGKPIYYNGAGGPISGRTPVTSREVNYEQCTEENELSVGAIAGFGNNKTDLGVAIRGRIYPIGTIRTLALFREKGTDLAGALTREIGLGSADLFYGVGYNYNTFEFNSYPYLTTGIDIKLAPKIDLNATVRIPININGNTGSNTDYFVGANLYF